MHALVHANDLLACTSIWRPSELFRLRPLHCRTWSSPLGGLVFQSSAGTQQGAVTKKKKHIRYHASLCRASATQPRGAGDRFKCRDRGKNRAVHTGTISRCTTPGCICAHDHQTAIHPRNHSRGAQEAQTLRLGDDQVQRVSGQAAPAFA